MVTVSEFWRWLADMASVNARLQTYTMYNVSYYGPKDGMVALWPIRSRGLSAEIMMKCMEIDLHEGLISQDDLMVIKTSMMAIGSARYALITELNDHIHHTVDFRSPREIEQWRLRMTQSGARY
jgi:hypothetical protein